MTVKQADPALDFLNSYWELKMEERRTERKIEELDAQCKSMTARMTGMPRGGGGDYNAAWDALIDAKDKANDTVIQAIQQAKEIERFIDTLNGPLLRQLLRGKYLELRTLEQIAVELQYSERHVSRLHGQALQEARRKWAEIHPGDYSQTGGYQDV